MKTVAVQIGNSDNRLTQADWARFIVRIRLSVDMFAEQLHFCASSPGDSIWQNHAWIFEIKEENIPLLKEQVYQVRKDFNQDSLAWTEGETVFL